LLLQGLPDIHLLILFGYLLGFAWKERLSLHHFLEVEVIQASTRPLTFSPPSSISLSHHYTEPITSAIIL
jgi:hypothetical protein